MELYGLLAASGIYNWPVIKQISWLLGQVMNGIYNVMSSIGIENIGICIIIFTVIVYMLLMPLTIKQQKFSKMQTVLQPEIQKIQKKYANKRDQVSMQKQQDEMNMVYEKYGVKMSSGCLPSLLQILILFGLYPVVQYIPDYVTKVRNVYLPLVDGIQATSGYQGIMEEVAKGIAIGSPDYSNPGQLIEVLYRFQNSTWEALIDKMPNLESVAHSTMNQISHLNNFLGIDIGSHPWEMLKDAFAAASIVGIILAILIPVLAGLTQFISVKLTQMGSTGAALNDSDNPMVNSMKTMTYTMPLISVVFGFTLPAGLGLYWVVSAVVRSIQQLCVNKYLKKKSVEDIIEENRKKAQKKREKKGASAKEINKMATTSTRNVGNTARSNSKKAEAEKEEKIQRAQQLAQNAKPGSLTSKANLVSRYNSGNKTEKPASGNAEKEPEDKAQDKKKK
ncbi:YidC/Oxa1 family membrane protein insertase [Clostridium sp. Marseille-P3244]|uniref:YidC/Oxa1 family membrane protein insertase n=1 Tax=Clostridium sp. Marseille-P3244 TaxID=1871020 RepID=UPI000930BA7B|nr:YidC/Oxa1 family membrane protein insertase [Clostridium sp. Marseille-P3244]